MHWTDWPNPHTSNGRASTGPEEWWCSCISPRRAHFGHRPLAGPPQNWGHLPSFAHHEAIPTRELEPYHTDGEKGTLPEVYKALLMYSHSCLLTVSSCFRQLIEYSCLLLVSSSPVTNTYVIIGVLCIAITDEGSRRLPKCLERTSSRSEFCSHSGLFKCIIKDNSIETLQSALGTMRTQRVR